MSTYITGLDLSDGKAILLLAPSQMSEGDGLQLKRELEARFPGCQFLVLTGGFQAIATTKDAFHYEIED